MLKTSARATDNLGIDSQGTVRTTETVGPVALDKPTCLGLHTHVKMNVVLLLVQQGYSISLHPPHLLRH